MIQAIWTQVPELCTKVPCSLTCFHSWSPGWSPSSPLQAHPCQLDPTQDYSHPRLSPQSTHSHYLSSMQWKRQVKQERGKERATLTPRWRMPPLWSGVPQGRSCSAPAPEGCGQETSGFVPCCPSKGLQLGEHSTFKISRSA